MAYPVVVTLGLGLLIIAAGIPKVVDVAPFHRKVMSDYAEYCEVMPQLTMFLEPHSVCNLAGVFEIMMGTILWLGRPYAQWFGAFFMLGFMILGLYLMYSVNVPTLELLFNVFVTFLLAWLVFND